MSSEHLYVVAADRIRRPPRPASSAPSTDLSELVRLGTLAASSHNTQPWKFEIADGTIRIFPDRARRCPAVDPDDAHLYKSLGCAAENIVQAAAGSGRRADVAYDADADAVTVQLTADPSCRGTDLAAAIPFRQCTRARYDGRPIDGPRIEALRRAGTSTDVRTVILADDESKRAITDFVSEGNLDQLSDPDWRRELISWIRPNDRAALDSGDGLAGRTSGQPNVPTWLARFILPLVIRPRAQVRTDAANIASSAAVVVFVSRGDHPAVWVDVGRCYERFALRATTLDIRNAFINQPIEVAAIRPIFEQWLGLDADEHAQLLVRVGTGPQMPFSVRRPLDDVIGVRPHAS